MPVLATNLRSGNAALNKAGTSGVEGDGLLKPRNAWLDACYDTQLKNK